jgi:diacylglycerol kinase (ATP)
MRVTLIHNPGAGDEGQSDERSLRALIAAAGHEVQSHSTEDDWSGALDRDADLVAVAGGDGTVGRVARRLIGRGVPIAVLSMGTANNIARSLGIHDIDNATLIRGWSKARRVREDAAEARGPWGTRSLVEGLGIGLFAWTMPQAEDSKKLSELETAEEAVSHVLKMLRKRLNDYKPREITATLDGKDISGQYLMFEAMLQQYIGPNLHLAPDARPDDELLHVVTIAEAQSERVAQYLSNWEDGKKPFVNLPTHSGRHLKIASGQHEVHLDDRLWPDPDTDEPQPGEIDVKVVPGAIEFLLPR